MKRIIHTVFLLLLLTGGLLAGSFEKPRFYIKFRGLGSLAKGGDYGDFVTRNETYYNDLNTLPLHTVSTVTTPFFRGYGGEIGIEVNRFALGFSADFMEKNFHIDYRQTAENSAYENTYTRDYRFSAIPIFVFFHYKLIDAPFLGVSLTLGEGVYLGTYRDDREQRYKGYNLTYVNSTVKARKNRLGFHLGTTIDLKVTRNLALFIEAAYRMVNFKDIKAESYYEDDGQVAEDENDFYYMTNNRTDEARFSVGDPGGIFWTRLPAVLDLNGFSFGVGIKITFGKKWVPPVKVAPTD